MATAYTSLNPSQRLVEDFKAAVLDPDPANDPFRRKYEELKKNYPSGVTPDILSRELSADPVMAPVVQRAYGSEILPPGLTSAKTGATIPLPKPVPSPGEFAQKTLPALGQAAFEARRPGEAPRPLKELLAQSLTGLPKQESTSATDFLHEPVLGPVAPLAVEAVTRVGEKILGTPEETGKYSPTREFTIGLGQGLTEAGIDLTSPMNIGTMVALAKMPWAAVAAKGPALAKAAKAAKLALSVYFGGSMGKASLEGFEEASRLQKEGDYRGVGREMAKAIVDGLFAFGTTKHAWETLRTPSGQIGGRTATAEKTAQEAAPAAPAAAAVGAPESAPPPAPAPAPSLAPVRAGAGRLTESEARQASLAMGERKPLPPEEIEARLRYAWERVKMEAEAAKEKPVIDEKMLQRVLGLLPDQGAARGQGMSASHKARVLFSVGNKLGLWSVKGTELPAAAATTPEPAPVVSGAEAQAQPQTAAPPPVLSELMPGLSPEQVGRAVGAPPRKAPTPPTLLKMPAEEAKARDISRRLYGKDWDELDGITQINILRQVRSGVPADIEIKSVTPESVVYRSPVADTDTTLPRQEFVNRYPAYRGVLAGQQAATAAPASPADLAPPPEVAAGAAMPSQAAPAAPAAPAEAAAPPAAPAPLAVAPIEPATPTTPTTPAAGRSRARRPKAAAPAAPVAPIVPPKPVEVAPPTSGLRTSVPPEAPPARTTAPPPPVVSLPSTDNPKPGDLFEVPGLGRYRVSDVSGNTVTYEFVPSDPAKPRLVVPVDRKIFAGMSRLRPVASVAADVESTPPTPAPAPEPAPSPVQAAGPTAVRTGRAAARPRGKAERTSARAAGAEVTAPAPTPAVPAPPVPEPPSPPAPPAPPAPELPSAPAAPKPRRPPKSGKAATEGQKAALESAAPSTPAAPPAPVAPGRPSAPPARAEAAMAATPPAKTAAGLQPGTDYIVAESSPDLGLVRGERLTFVGSDKGRLRFRDTEGNLSIIQASLADVLPRLRPAAEPAVTTATPAAPAPAPAPAAPKPVTSAPVPEAAPPKPVAPAEAPKAAPKAGRKAAQKAAAEPAVKPTAVPPAESQPKPEAKVAEAEKPAAPVQEQAKPGEAVVDISEIPLGARYRRTTPAEGTPERQKLVEQAEALEKQHGAIIESLEKARQAYERTKAGTDRRIQLNQQISRLEREEERIAPEARKARAAVREAQLEDRIVGAQDPLAQAIAYYRLLEERRGSEYERRLLSDYFRQELRRSVEQAYDSVKIKGEELLSPEDRAPTVEAAAMEALNRTGYEAPQDVRSLIERSILWAKREALKGALGRSLQQHAENLSREIEPEVGDSARAILAEANRLTRTVESAGTAEALNEAKQSLNQMAESLRAEGRAEIERNRIDLDALQPVASLKPARSWEGNVVEPGEFISDGGLLMRARSVASESQRQKLSQEPKGGVPRRIRQEEVERVLRDLSSRKMQDALPVGAQENRLYLINRQGTHMVAVDAKSFNLAKAALRWDQAKMAFGREGWPDRIVYYKGGEIVGVQTPFAGEATADLKAALAKAKQQAGETEPAPRPVKAARPQPAAKAEAPKPVVEPATPRSEMAAPKPVAEEVKAAVAAKQEARRARGKAKPEAEAEAKPEAKAEEKAAEAEKPPEVADAIERLKALVADVIKSEKGEWDVDREVRFWRTLLRREVPEEVGELGRFANDLYAVARWHLDRARNALLGKAALGQPVSTDQIREGWTARMIREFGEPIRGFLELIWSKLIPTGWRKVRLEIPYEELRTPLPPVPRAAEKASAAEKPAEPVAEQPTRSIPEGAAPPPGSLRLYKVKELADKKGNVEWSTVPPRPKYRQVWRPKGDTETIFNSLRQAEDRGFKPSQLERAKIEIRPAEMYVAPEHAEPFKVKEGVYRIPRNYRFPEVELPKAPRPRPAGYKPPAAPQEPAVPIEPLRPGRTHRPGQPPSPLRDLLKEERTEPTVVSRGPAPRIEPTPWTRESAEPPKPLFEERPARKGEQKPKSEEESERWEPPEEVKAAAEKVGMDMLKRPAEPGEYVFQKTGKSGTSYQVKFDVVDGAWTAREYYPDGSMRAHRGEGEAALIDYLMRRPGSEPRALSAAERRIAEEAETMRRPAPRPIFTAKRRVPEEAPGQLPPAKELFQIIRGAIDTSAESYARELAAARQRVEDLQKAAHSAIETAVQYGLRARSQEGREASKRNKIAETEMQRAARLLQTAQEYQKQLEQLPKPGRAWEQLSPEEKAKTVAFLVGVAQFRQSVAVPEVGPLEQRPYGPERIQQLVTAATGIAPPPPVETKPTKETFRAVKSGQVVLDVREVSGVPGARAWQVMLRHRGVQEPHQEANVYVVKERGRYSVYRGEQWTPENRVISHRSLTFAKRAAADVVERFMRQEYGAGRPSSGPKSPSNVVLRPAGESLSLLTPTPPETAITTSASAPKPVVEVPKKKEAERPEFWKHPERGALDISPLVSAVERMTAAMRRGAERLKESSAEKGETAAAGQPVSQAGRAKQGSVAADIGRIIGENLGKKLDLAMRLASGDYETWEAEAGNLVNAAMRQSIDAIAGPIARPSGAYGPKVVPSTLHPIVAWPIKRFYRESIRRLAESLPQEFKSDRDRDQTIAKLAAEWVDGREGSNVFIKPEFLQRLSHEAILESIPRDLSKVPEDRLRFYGQLLGLALRDKTLEQARYPDEAIWLDDVEKVVRSGFWPSQWEKITAAKEERVMRYLSRAASHPEGAAAIVRMLDASVRKSLASVFPRLAKALEGPAKSAEPLKPGTQEPAKTTEASAGAEGLSRRTALKLGAAAPVAISAAGAAPSSAALARAVQASLMSRFPGLVADVVKMKFAKPESGGYEAFPADNKEALRDLLRRHPNAELKDGVMLVDPISGVSIAMVGEDLASMAKKPPEKWKSPFGGESGAALTDDLWDDSFTQASTAAAMIESKFDRMRSNQLESRLKQVETEIKRRENPEAAKAVPRPKVEPKVAPRSAPGPKAGQTTRLEFLRSLAPKLEEKSPAAPRPVVSAPKVRMESRVEKGMTRAQFFRRLAGAEEQPAPPEARMRSEVPPKPALEAKEAGQTGAAAPRPALLERVRQGVGGAARRVQEEAKRFWEEERGEADVSRMVELGKRLFMRKDFPSYAGTKEHPVTAWVAPTGEKVGFVWGPRAGHHLDVASKLVGGRTGPGGRWSNPEEVLLDQGWIRLHGHSIECTDRAVETLGLMEAVNTAVVNAKRDGKSMIILNVHRPEGRYMGGVPLETVGDFLADPIGYLSRYGMFVENPKLARQGR